MREAGRRPQAAANNGGSSPTAPSKHPVTRLTRVPSRGDYSRETIDAVLDEAVVCHLGLIRDGYPAVVPTLHARVGDDVYIHGSSASSAVRNARDGIDVCLTATLIDGLVLARSAFHHSVNYRSVMLFGRCEAIEDEESKRHALEAFMCKIVPGRWSDVRPPTKQELKATAVLRLGIDLASAKVRSGPPVDDADDYQRDVWAGVVPLRLNRLPAEPDPQLAYGIRMPDYLLERR